MAGPLPTDESLRRQVTPNSRMSLIGPQIFLNIALGNTFRFSTRMVNIMAEVNLLPSLASKVALARRNTTRNTSLSMLKPKQVDALLALQFQDVLAVLPTGYGKSLVFELLPEYDRVMQLAAQQVPLPVTVIVIIPLNSIINEQAERYYCTHFHGVLDIVTFHITIFLSLFSTMIISQVIIIY